MRTCPNCGRENANDVDFCQCGAYLRWEPTNYQMPAVTPQTAEPEAPAPPPEPADVAPPAEPPPTNGAPAAPPAPEPTKTAPTRPQPPPEDHFISGVRPAVPQPRARRGPPAAQAPPPNLGPNSTLPYARAVPEQPAEPAQPAHQGPPPSAAITLRLPGEEAGAAAGPVAVAVTPGDRIRVLATVRNQGAIVDNYSLIVHGFPQEWCTIMPETVYLVPLGAKGSFEQEVEIHLHPPRDPGAEARRWELRVGVYSHAAESEIASAPMTLGIHPYEDCTVRVRPERATGRRFGKFDVTVVNNANAVTKLALDAQDNDGACRFDFERDTVELRPGQSKVVPLRCRPPRQIWIGRSRDRFLQILAAGGEAGEQLLIDKEEAKASGSTGGGLKKKLGAGGMPKLPGVSGPKMNMPQIGLGPGGKPNIGMPNMRGPQFRGVNLRRPTMGLKALKMPGGQAAPEVEAAPLLPTQAVFRQKAWLPWWLAIVVPLLILLALLLYMLWPRTITVPDLVGSKDVAEAQAKLPDKLKLGVTRSVVSAKAPGTVIGQHPKAGETAKQDSLVDVSVAVSSQDTTVPTLVGLTLSQAEGALNEAGLTLGAVGPTSPPDPKAKISGQLPSAGAAAKVGAAVAITYDPPAEDGGKGGKDSSKTGDKGGPSGTGGGGKGGGGGGGDITIPDPNGATETAYAASLQKLGLTSAAVRSLGYPGADTVMSTIPEAGSKVDKGAKVTLRVSAGFPLMAYDNQANVKLFDGRQLPALAKSDELEQDPTFSPNGHTVVYVEDGQLVAADVRDRQFRRVLTSGAARYAHPTFAPTNEDAVLAMVRVNDDGDGDLCFGRVKEDSFKPECIADDKVHVRAARWLGTGNAIILNADRDGELGIYQYTSAKPFSADKSNWKDGRFVTEPGKRGVFDAALSPDGKLLAASANIQGKGFSLYLTDKTDNIKLTGLEPLPILACKLQWIDNQNLAIVKFNADCEQGASGVGEIVRINVTDKVPTPVPIVRQADNPVFRPLAGG
jgi:beta-lactam-binding protein with PASTA domain